MQLKQGDIVRRIDGKGPHPKNWIVESIGGTSDDPVVLFLCGKWFSASALVLMHPSEDIEAL